MFLLGLINHHPEEKIVITLNDGTERFFDYLIEDVVKFWSVVKSPRRSTIGHHSRAHRFKDEQSYCHHS